MENTENKKSHTLNRTSLIVGIVSLVVIIILGVLYFNNRNQMSILVDEMVQEKEMLTYEFETLALDFDSLKTNSDDLNAMLEIEREKISHLIEEIQTVKATNAAKIREYKKELTGLRKVMKSYVLQIDSLNQSNKVLTAENQQYKTKVTNMQTTYTKLEVLKESLQEKVDIASKIETFNMEAMPMNSKGRKISKTSRVSKIRICFRMQKNITTKVGEKNIYLRILRPDGALLYHSQEDLFAHENDRINYSAMRTIEYGGEEVDVCLFYQVDAGELIEGEYVADIFADGRNIGTHTFKLD